MPDILVTLSRNGLVCHLHSSPRVQKQNVHPIQLSPSIPVPVPDTELGVRPALSISRTSGWKHSRVSVQLPPAAVLGQQLGHMHLVVTAHP